MYIILKEPKGQLEPIRLTTVDGTMQLARPAPGVWTPLSVNPQGSHICQEWHFPKGLALTLGRFMAFVGLRTAPGVRTSGVRQGWHRAAPCVLVSQSVAAPPVTLSCPAWASCMMVWSCLACTLNLAASFGNLCAMVSKENVVVLFRFCSARMGLHLFLPWLCASAFCTGNCETAELGLLKDLRAPQCTPAFPSGLACTFSCTPARALSALTLLASCQGLNPPSLSLAMVKVPRPPVRGLKRCICPTHIGLTSPN